MTPHIHYGGTKPTIELGLRKMPMGSNADFACLQGNDGYPVHQASDSSENLGKSVVISMPIIDRVFHIIYYSGIELPGNHILLLIVG